MHGYIDIWNRYIYISTDKQNANSIYISQTVYICIGFFGLGISATGNAAGTHGGPLQFRDRWNPQLSIIGWIIGYQCGIISSTMVIIVYNGFFWDLLGFNHQQWELSWG